MADNWSVISGKLSSKENKIVEEFISEHKISKNELLLKSLRLYIPMMQGVKVLTGNDYGIAKDFNDGINKIIKSKDYKLKTVKLLEKLSKKYSDQGVIEYFFRLGIVETLQKELESPHNPKGRPKIKRKRGRP